MEILKKGHPGNSSLARSRDKEAGKKLWLQTKHKRAFKLIFLHAWSTYGNGYVNSQSPTYSLAFPPQNVYQRCISPFFHEDPTAASVHHTGEKATRQSLADN